MAVSAFRRIRNRNTLGRNAVTQVRSWSAPASIIPWTVFIRNIKNPSLLIIIKQRGI
jgi:hypothetical protein